MSFIKYPHLERFGTDAVDGINIGECHVFPKIDGTNASVWKQSDTYFAGSRNRELAIGDDNAGFYHWLTQDLKTAAQSQPVRDLLDALPEGTIVYGEWLVPHSLKTYREDAWRRFYVFDVLTPNHVFMHYDDYSAICQRFGVDFIPCMTKATNPSYEQLVGCCERNTFLLQENSGFGEGVVIKQYGWVNRFGQTTWAKLITNTFKDKHIQEMGGSVITNKMVEESIVEENVDRHLVDKIVAKIRNEAGAFGARDIPRLLHTAYHDLVTECLWDALKKHKSPKIDFKTLNHFCVARVKALMPELFGVKA